MTDSLSFSILAMLKRNLLKITYITMIAATEGKDQISTHHGFRAGAINDDRNGPSHKPPVEVCNRIKSVSPTTLALP